MEVIPADSNRKSIYGSVIECYAVTEIKILPKPYKAVYSK